MENIERAEGVGVAGVNVGRQGGKSVEQPAQCCVSLDTVHIYPEVPVDGELIAWPYLRVARSGADLECLEARADSIGIFLANE